MAEKENIEAIIEHTALPNHHLGDVVDEASCNPGTTVKRVTFNGLAINVIPQIDTCETCLLKEFCDKTVAS